MKVKIFVLGALMFFAKCMIAQPAADAFMRFLNMESGHKADWFDYMIKVHTEKYEMLKRQHADWFNYKIQNLREWKNNTDCSEGGKENIFNEQLAKAIKLHKRHMAQFGALCNAEHNEARAVQAKHEQELNNFISSAYQQPRREFVETVELDLR